MWKEDYIDNWKWTFNWNPLLFFSLRYFWLLWKMKDYANNLNQSNDDCHWYSMICLICEVFSVISFPLKDSFILLFISTPWILKFSQAPQGFASIKRGGNTQSLESVVWMKWVPSVEALRPLLGNRFQLFMFFHPQKHVLGWGFHFIDH